MYIAMKIRECETEAGFLGSAKTQKEVEIV